MSWLFDTCTVLAFEADEFIFRKYKLWIHSITRVLLHLMLIAYSVPTDVRIINRSSVMDFFVLLLSFIEHVEQKVFFDTGTGNQRRLIHVQAMFEKVGPEVCSRWTPHINMV